MKDFNVPSPEVQNFIDSLGQTQAIASLTQIIEQRVQEQLESHLLQFQESIAQSNAIAVDLMLEELSKIKEENATVKGALKKLSSAIAPDLPPEEEVVSFRQAIDNLEKYGSIIPSSEDIASKRRKSQNNHAWSLFRQAIAKIIIKKLEKFLENRLPT
jgi:hypothetical protein